LGAIAISWSRGGTLPVRSCLQLQLGPALLLLQTKFSSRGKTQPTQAFPGLPAAFFEPKLQTSNAVLFGHVPPGVNGCDSECVL